MTRTLTLVALLALVCGCGGAASLLVGQGDEALQAGRVGDALAAYDAAYDDDPNDADIAAKRRKAAAAWITETAPDAASGPPERAYALLTALALEGDRRGAQAAVAEHVTARLQTAVEALWKPAAGDEPAVLWRSIHQGERLMLGLPVGSSLRQAIVEERARAATLLAARARAASHPGARFVYAAMAARLGERPLPDPDAALVERTELGYTLRLESDDRSKPVARALEAKIAEATGTLPDNPDGIPVEVVIVLRGHPLREPWETTETRHWVQTQVARTGTTTCWSRERLLEAGSTTESYNPYTHRTTTTHRPSRYETVPDCRSSVTTTVEREHKSEPVTVTHEEVGFDTTGSLHMATPDEVHAFPLAARTVGVKLTTRGAESGTHRRDVDTSTLPRANAHGLWLEILYGKAFVREQLADEARQAARAASGDEALGEMVVAVRLHERVTQVDRAFFDEALGLDPQHVAELLLGAPVVAPTPLEMGSYQLTVPRLTPEQRRRLIQQRVESGSDDY